MSICSEIPFLDAPEGACITTVTHKPELIGAGPWKAQRATMIMLKASDWVKIEKIWLATCRAAGGDCDVTVSSVADTIYRLDDLAGSILQGFHP